MVRDSGSPDRGQAGSRRHGVVSFDDSQGAEPARVAVKPAPAVGSCYEGVKVPSEGFTEIDLIEVRETMRHKGVGRAVVEAVEELYPGTQLAALSEQADKFWASRGWTRARSPGGPRRGAFRSLSDA